MTDQSAATWISAAAQQQRQQQGLPARQLSDAPVHQAYLDSLRRSGAQITAVSKWLNAAAVEATSCQAELLRQKCFVQQVTPITGYFQAASRSKKKDEVLPVLDQINAQKFREKGLTGKGVKVGVIDVGFYEAPQQASLKRLFNQDHVRGYRDFVNPAAGKPYTYKESFLDNHGTQVLECLAGYNPKHNLQVGLATEADYYLARTDHGSRENRMEEEHFVRALEWLDSLGVRLVNSSLGYGTGFDKAEENYKPEQMDGSSFIARAAQMAVQEKGMCLVISAGNDGSKKNWQFLNTPADAAGVLTVGATDYSSWIKQGYSGIGPGFLPFVKPDLACFSAFGTSFTAPVVTGLAACLLQVNPHLSAQQLTQILKRSGHLYPHGNNYIGYGVPNAEKALQLARDSTIVFPAPTIMKASGNQFSFKRPKDWKVVGQGGIVLFRKKSATQVITQQRLSVRTTILLLKRMTGETHTTIQFGENVLEVVWE
ncbi:S8 family serine peptidase [Nibribacter ruber]|uniref:S8 family serine peptidase n=1 Tax=Nibribacter ruber TaxID=2698458 RepID=A0A6P1NU00_9BACT|nr:S8 family serine peptidase [Nibribacter ruber]QHL87346.1 S8 family serine peptidase [Nibribacter ruber]